MNNKRDTLSSQEETEKVSGPRVDACLQNLYTVNELRGYLRAREAGGGMPPELMDHLKTCRECDSTWQFLSQTDELLKEHRDERVGLILRQVHLEETAVFRRKEEVDFSGIGREIKEFMSFIDESLVPTLQRILNTASPLDPFKVCEVCEIVRSMKDEDVRRQKAIELANLFEARVSATNDFNTANVVFEAPAMVDLKKLARENDLAFEVPVAFVASIPHVSFVQGAPILEVVEQPTKTIVVHADRLREAIATHGNNLQRTSGAQTF